MDIFDVLSRTENIFLPGLSEEQKEAVQQTQPELLYSILLTSCHSNNKCLDMWKCLNPQTWTSEYYPKPNFVHYFVVAYSYLAGVPIFTVNYDTMFETACLELGIEDYEVLLNPPADCMETPDHILRICKLHGDACFNADGDINPAIFKTTMSEISRINQPWLVYISAFQRNKHFCFIGYSGRDIDYYPHMKKVFQKPETPEPFWLMSKKTIDDREETFLNAERIGRTIIIKNYPNVIFPVIYEKVFSRTKFQAIMERLYAEPHEKIDSGVKKHFLDLLQEKIQKIPINPHIFWLIFCQHTGRNKELYQCLCHLHMEDMDLEKWERYLFFNAKIRSECVHAKFLKYRKAAKEMLSFANSVKEKMPEDYHQIMNAKLQIISSYQMTIPAHLAFKIPVYYRKYIRALFVRFRFFLLNLGFKYFIRWKKKKFNMLADITIITVQEAKLRAYSMDMKLNPKRCKNKLEDLKREAGEKGNYTTFYGVDKYLNRLAASKDRLDDIARAVAMTNEYSTESIAKRDLGHYRDALDIAIKDDDTLGIIKDLLGVAYIQYQKRALTDKDKGSPLLSEDDEKLLLQKMKEVEAESLTNAFAYIYQKYF